MKVTVRAQMVNVFEKERTDGGNIKVNFTIADRIKRIKGQSGPFIRCTAYGRMAEKILEDFSERDKDGKLISRKLIVYGDMGYYMKDESFEIKETISASKLFDLFEYEIDEEDKLEEVDIKFNKVIQIPAQIITVSDIEYDDYKEGDTSKYSKKKPQELSLSRQSSNESSYDKEGLSDFDMKARENKFKEFLDEIDED